MGGKVLGTYLTVALTHLLRDTQPGRPWRHTLFVLGADKLRGDVLDRLSDACERSATGLVLAYRGIPPHVRQRLGRGNAAVAFMRLGNAEDAKAASEQLGTEHRFVLSQLTETIGVSVTDTTSSAYTSTTGSAELDRHLVVGKRGPVPQYRARPQAAACCCRRGRASRAASRPVIRGAAARASRSAPASARAPPGG